MELIECGIPPGLAHTIIKILQEVKILSKSGKFVSSNSYFLTVLSSLKLLPQPVSGTQVSFSNYAYLLSSLKLLHLLVS